MKKILLALIVLTVVLVHVGADTLQIGVSPYSFQSIHSISAVETVLIDKYGAATQCSYVHDYNGVKRLGGKICGQWYLFDEEMNEVIVDLDFIMGRQKTLGSCSLYYDFGIGVSMCMIEELFQAHMNLCADVGLCFNLGNVRSFADMEFKLTPQLGNNTYKLTASLFIRPTVGVCISL